MIELRHSFQLEAAHHLPQVPEGHKCRRLHGHSFKVTLELAGEVSEPEGWLVDFADVATAFQPVHDALDHRYLNEIEGLENATSENLARWIFERVAPTLPGLEAVTVAETCQASCRYVASGDRRS